MNICGIQGAGGKDPKESVRQYLSSKAAGKWLLVVDSSDDMEILQGSTDKRDSLSDFLPRSDGGQILYTTRSREVAVSVAKSNVLDVPEMSQDEGRGCLENSLIRKDLLHDHQAVDGLFDVLNYLPLAITQAATYLNENQITVTEYL